MKKLQILLVAVLLCGNVFAQEEAAVTIKLKCTVSVGTQSRNYTSNPLILVQASGYHRDKFDQGESVNLSTFPNPCIYAKTTYIAKMYTTAYMNDFVDIPLSIVTNLATEYNLEFANQRGDTLWLKDTQEDVTFPMVQGCNYHFSINPNEVSSRDDIKTIEGRFVIVEKPAVVEDYKICFVKDHLQIYNYPITDPIVVKNRDGVEKMKVAPVIPEQDIDLSDLDAGQYIVIANNDTLTVSVKLPKTIK